MNAIIDIPVLKDIERKLDEVLERLDRATEPPPELVNVKEAAKMIGVTEATIRQWARDGSLPIANRVGKKMMFLRDDIQSSRSARSSGDSA